MNERTKNEIVVYQPDETLWLEVQRQDESIWLPQQKIADLFGIQKAAISKHLKNIFETGELQENLVVSKMGTTTQHGAIDGTDISKFNAQYSALTVHYTEKFHDRFLVLDDKEIFLIGASLKDLGKKCFAFTKLDAGEIAGIKARV